MKKSKYTLIVNRKNGVREARWEKIIEKPKIKISKEAKIFVERKSGKTIRKLAMDLNLPLRDYKKVVNRLLNKRVKDNTQLNEQDLHGIIHFISKVLPIRDRILGKNKKARRRKTFDPWEHNQLLEFLGKPYTSTKEKKVKQRELKWDYYGMKTVNSIKPVKYRTTRVK